MRLNSDKPLLAVALKYRRNEDSAPRVIAKGRGYTAEKIIELAEQNHLPVESNANLAQILDSIEIDQYIPYEVFDTVAKIFAVIGKSKN